MHAHTIAEFILKGFKKHYQLFQKITAQAPVAFAEQDWPQMHKISHLRISHYDDRVNETIIQLKKAHLAFSDQLDETLWLASKQHYQQFLQFHPQAELAETFYNSVFCRLFHRRYFNNNFIFVETSLADAPALPIEAEYRSFFPVIDGLKPTIKKIISQFDFRADFENLERDIRLLVKAFYKQAPDTHHSAWQMRFDILQTPFYRNKAAYIVGRVVSSSGIQPFIIPVLHHKQHGLYLDALLTNSSQMRVIFGFARAYFMVETHAPSALVRFLNQLMPNKTLAELYNAIGFHKQGKTEFYREFLTHLERSDDNFIIAPGTPGMVMMVFTLPSFGYVFKIIKDKFGESKPFGRDTVLKRYQLVKSHDRVGRMADTIEYSNVVFPLARFDDNLLSQLKSTIGESMVIDNDLVIIKHLYIERRMTPLNLFLESATEDEAVTAITEYGQALKEMIAVNIFPGDMLLKNFGVSNHKRIIFYDYDEVQYLSDMNFRALPKAKSYDDYLINEQSYSVAPQDVFPEQLCTFVMPNPRYKAIFTQAHPELLDVNFWQQAQKNIKDGVVSHIYPYPSTQRFIKHW
ncbi:MULTISPECIES: bifunctional isocitrate dehydrogenase kinase/phosphatase [unclassified Pseudoalteromonas]|uniref:bifunctional isocitrate dehydrogenase kinase/phosphatase n=1 Tax=unclassified Pseudoalteromonas TaxID=194690 RepID=UPI000C08B81B|nr:MULTISPECIES: bifunctional isocitrate dehydrogenase kinase/phosphatase [unclassified Pseudoalteromonas]MDP2634790.1 bifunctional isocitrate dehydrogenase kinase/phosphatase [Pseudoalteromonas sp. 1_MG-2023]PHN91391.1 bifunctional isocitrate dehydrogenase kinase/phosphatase [Pseudoalteromonas sp. 3D05]